MVVRYHFYHRTQATARLNEATPNRQHYSDSDCFNLFVQSVVNRLSDGVFHPVHDDSKLDYGARLPHIQQKPRLPLQLRSSDRHPSSLLLHPLQHSVDMFLRSLRRSAHKLLQRPHFAFLHAIYYDLDQPLHGRKEGDSSQEQPWTASRLLDCTVNHGIYTYTVQFS